MIERGRESQCRATLVHRLAVLALSACAAFALAACVTHATGVVVSLDTDAPPDQLERVTVWVLDGTVPRDAGNGVDLVRDGGHLALPASFGITPAPGQSHDGVALVRIDAQLAPESPGGEPRHLTRTARFRFVPETTARLPVFLSVLCGAADTGCTSVPAAHCTRSVHCAEMPGQTCGESGRCVADSVRPDVPDAAQCASGTTSCAGGCVATDSDPGNCGACGVVCASGMCMAGVCAAACTSSQTRCGGACVDTASDVANCGACAHACAFANASAACANGACALAGCTEGHDDRDGDPSNGCEATGLAALDTPSYRLVDTRPGAAALITPGAPLSAAVAYGFDAVGPSGTPFGATAFEGSITAVSPGSAGFVAIVPSTNGMPPVSTVNFAAGATTTAGFIAPSHFVVWASTPVDVIIDVHARFAPVAPSTMNGGYYFHPLSPPVRVYDSRSTSAQLAAGAITQVPIGGRTVGSIAFPATMRGVVGTLTVVPGTVGGYVTAFDADETMRPVATSLSFVGSEITTAGFTSFTSDGPRSALALYTSQNTHVVVDVTGYFSASRDDGNGTGTYYYPLDAPVRLVDTRAGRTACANIAPLVAGADASFVARGWTCATTRVPASARALHGTIAALGATNSYISLGPSGVMQTTRITAVSFDANVAATASGSEFTSAIGVDDRCGLWSPVAGNLLIDATGYFAP